AHAIQKHGHQQRRHLVIRDLMAHVTTQEKSDLVFCKVAAVSLFADNFERRHCLGGAAGSALSTHAVYQRLPSIVAARARCAAMNSVPFGFGLFGLNSPSFSN